MSAKTNLKLAKLWLDRKEYGRLQKVWTMTDFTVVSLIVLCVRF